MPRRQPTKKQYAAFDARFAEAFDLVSISAALDEETPQETLALLAKSSQYVVRHEVAGNCTTPKRQLSKLARDAESCVRCAVACNPCASRRSRTIASSTIKCPAKLTDRACEIMIAYFERLQRMKKEISPSGQKSLSRNYAHYWFAWFNKKGRPRRLKPS